MQGVMTKLMVMRPFLNIDQVDYFKMQTIKMHRFSFRILHVHMISLNLRVFGRT